MLPRPRDTKHIACSRCRDRKVKCDGQKPGCRRCQRLGHPCQYIQGKKSHGKGEWVQHLTTFSSQPSRHFLPLPPPPTRNRPNVDPSCKITNHVFLPQTKPHHTNRTNPNSHRPRARSDRNPPSSPRTQTPPCLAPAPRALTSDTRPRRRPRPQPPRRTTPASPSS